MSKGKKRTEAEKSAQRARTAKNKINAIQRALQHAGGTHIARLQERLAFWQGKR
ncbi:MAG TPA: hypothetical protein VFU72_03025 [Nitrolancea sp.]|nr:hypothetical protein [Nitrolancea sp.]